MEIRKAYKLEFACYRCWMFWCWFCLWASSSQQALLGSPVEQARRFLTTSLWLPLAQTPSQSSSGVVEESKGTQRTASTLQRHHSLMCITCRLLLPKLGCHFQCHFQWPYKTLPCMRRDLWKSSQLQRSWLENLLINTNIFLHTVKHISSREEMQVYL